jgi:hypothetical protein
MHPAKKATFKKPYNRKGRSRPEPGCRRKGRRRTTRRRRRRSRRKWRKRR